MALNLLKRWQKRIFILCWLAYSFAYFCRVNVSAALPVIQQTYKWSNTSIGLIGSSLFWVYAAGQLINGHIGDKIGSRIYVFIGLLFSALINIAFGFADSLPVMIILWGANGLFQSMLWGPIIRTLSHWFNSRKINKVAIGISTTMVSGYLMAWAFSGLIITYASWRWVFFIPGIIVTVYSAIWYSMMRDNPEEVGAAMDAVCEIAVPEADYKREYSISLWKIIRSTSLIPIFAVCMAQGFIRDSVTLWSPKFLMETQHIPINSAIGFVTVIPVANFLGLMFAGWLNNKLGSQTKLTLTALFSVAVLTCLGLFIYSGNNIYISLVCLYTASALMAGANTLLVSVLPLQYAGYNKVSSIAGILDFCCYVGSGIMSALTGFLIDRTGWSGVIVSWIIVTFVGLCSVLFALIRSQKFSLRASTHLTVE